MSRCRSREQSKQVVLTDEARDGFAECIDGANCRCWVDDRGVRAEDELLDAERLDAQLEGWAAVGGGVEEDVRVHRGATLDASDREPLELDRRAAGEDREH